MLKGSKTPTDSSASPPKKRHIRAARQDGRGSTPGHNRAFNTADAEEKTISMVLLARRTRGSRTAGGGAGASYDGVRPAGARHARVEDAAGHGARGAPGGRRRAQRRARRRGRARRRPQEDAPRVSAHLIPAHSPN